MLLEHHSPLPKVQLPDRACRAWASGSPVGNHEDNGYFYEIARCSLISREREIELARRIEERRRERSQSPHAP